MTIDDRVFSECVMYLTWIIQFVKAEMPIFHKYENSHSLLSKWKERIKRAEYQISTKGQLWYDTLSIFSVYVAIHILDKYVYLSKFIHTENWSKPPLGKY